MNSEREQSTRAELTLHNPEATLKGLADAVAFADLRGAASCFRRDARLVTADRTTISGREQIAPVLAQLIDCQAELDFGRPALIRAEEVALASGPCSICTKGPDLFWLTQRSDLTAVLRLTEGDWKFAIFAPWCEPRLSSEEAGLR